MKILVDSMPKSKEECVFFVPDHVAGARDNMEKGKCNLFPLGLWPNPTTDGKVNRICTLCNGMCNTLISTEQAMRDIYTEGFIAGCEETTHNFEEME